MDECCKNCKYFSKLNIFYRFVQTIGGPGWVSGWKVGTEKYYGTPVDSFCCTAFPLLYNEDAITETLPDDKCELFEEAIVK